MPAEVAVAVAGGRERVLIIKWYVGKLLWVALLTSPNDFIFKLPHFVCGYANLLGKYCACLFCRRAHCTPYSHASKNLMHGPVHCSVHKFRCIYPMDSAIEILQFSFSSNLMADDSFVDYNIIICICSVVLLACLLALGIMVFLSMCVCRANRQRIRVV